MVIMRLTRGSLVKHKRLIIVAALLCLVTISGTAYALMGSDDDSSKQPQEVAGSSVTRTEDPAKLASKTAKQPKKSNTANEHATTLAKLNTSAAMGLYSGPGKVSAHDNFQKWLGKEIPYATDYIDYRGGWQKDFVDSRLWLSEPWGRWANQNGNRRLVLGVPMLQNENNGQFNQGIRGDFDKYFRYLAADLVKNNLGDTIIRLGYEANCDTIGPWQATRNPEGYRQLFRREVAVMRSVPGANFKFDWTVCNGLQDGRALNSFASFYPGNDVVDIMGMDIYDVKWRDVQASPQARWQHAADRRMGINEFLRFARSHGKPVSFPEWGLYKPGDNFAGGGDNPYFIEKMADLIRSTNPVYYSYFNLNWGGGVLSDFKHGEATYRYIFGG